MHMQNVRYILLRDYKGPVSDYANFYNVPSQVSQPKNPIFRKLRMCDRDDSEISIFVSEIAQVGC